MDAQKLARDLLRPDKTEEQFALLQRYAGGLEGKKFLEIGSGFGLLLAMANLKQGMQAHGLEPESAHFEGSFELSKELLRHYGLNPDMVHGGCGEAIPFADGTFDIVYSSNVLEHTHNPEKVIQECIRVLKPGGTLQLIVPNYGSFWEGHYCLFWIPYMPHWLAKIYVRLWGRSPDYVDTLQFIHYFSMKKWVKPFVQRGEVEILTWGEEIFSERMLKANINDWAGLFKLKQWVERAKRLGLVGLITRVMNGFKAFTPVILTARKRETPIGASRDQELIAAMKR